MGVRTGDSSLEDGRSPAVRSACPEAPEVTAPAFRRTLEAGIPREQARSSRESSTQATDAGNHAVFSLRTRRFRRRIPWALILAFLGASLAVVAVLTEGVRGHVVTAVIVVGLNVLLAILVLRGLRSAENGRAAADRYNAYEVAAVEGALDCVITIDSEGTVHQWNKAACTTFGYSKDEAIGHDLAELVVPPEHRGRHRRGVTETADGDQHGIIGRRMEVLAVHARGGQFPVELTVTQTRDDPAMFTVFVRDISEQRRREQENERLAAIVRSSEDAILSRDLDGVVTAWNSGAERLFGYSAQEAVGRRVVDLTVPPDRVAEVGAISRRVLDGGSAALITQRRTKRGETIDVSLRAFPIRNLAKEIVGISISAHDITAQRRREALELKNGEQKLWRRRIEEALAHDRLTFWAQPVVDVKTGALHHNELLLRMKLGDRVVTPFEFLPHAESCSLITEIDRWAITRGTQLGRTGKVAINLSAKGLSTPNLVDFVEKSLDEAQTPASNVLFEITETAAVENLDEAHKLVEDLRSLGCGAALDDFGTGYGSFTYLKHLPVSELKIDMSFVRGLLVDEVDQRIVKSIIHVAQNFEMTTVAEGVEDEETLSLLVEMGVDLVQGYHLGRPQPLPEEQSMAAASSAGVEFTERAKGGLA